AFYGTLLERRDPATDRAAPLKGFLFMASTGSPPDLSVSLCKGLEFRTPVIAASGGLGYGEEVADLADVAALGGLITPTLSLAPRAGNPMPRTAETTAGLLHSLGWPNPGLARFLSDRLPGLLA